MLVIRLQRTGRENVATYRIVVAEKARAVKGKFLEIIGHYLPARREPIFSVQQERIVHWMSRGAVPSGTIARLCKRHGIEGMESFIRSYTKRTSKKEKSEPAAAAPAPATPS